MCGSEVIVSTSELHALLCAERHEWAQDGQATSECVLARTEQAQHGLHVTETLQPCTAEAATVRCPTGNRLHARCILLPAQFPISRVRAHILMCTDLL